MEERRPARDEMYCVSCRAIIKTAAELCMNCGVRVGSRPGDFSSSVNRTESHNDYDYEPSGSASEWLFGFKGRISREGFWVRWLLSVAAFVIYAFLAVGGSYWLQTTALFALIVSLVLYASALVRRMHDFNKSGWLGLLTLVPFVNFFLWIACMVGRGDGIDPNDYGIRAR